jgi:hypothetical protein
MDHLCYLLKHHRIVHVSGNPIDTKLLFQQLVKQKGKFELMPKHGFAPVSGHRILVLQDIQNWTEMSLCRAFKTRSQLGIQMVLFSDCCDVNGGPLGPGTQVPLFERKSFLKLRVFRMWVKPSSEHTSVIQNVRTGDSYQAFADSLKRTDMIRTSTFITVDGFEAYRVVEQNHQATGIRPASTITLVNYWDMQKTSMFLTVTPQLVASRRAFCALLEKIDSLEQIHIFVDDTDEELETQELTPAGRYERDPYPDLVCDVGTDALSKCPLADSANLVAIAQAFM